MIIRAKGELLLAVAAFLIAGSVTAAGTLVFAPLPPVRDDGTITAPSFDLPFSYYASLESRAAFVRFLRGPKLTPIPDINKFRQMVDETNFAPQVAKQKEMFPYTSVRSRMGGVPVETFVPVAGITPTNRHRVLLNLHGGGFTVGGGGLGGAAESIPMAGVARVKVISVDYRQGPEYHFPAASEDVASVYRELLETYRPENIGIYGCSAGGMLTGEAISWFLKEHLPLPGAIGIFCASTHQFGEGDSAQLWPHLGSLLNIVQPVTPDPDRIVGPGAPYFADASPKDPLVVPSASKEVLGAFPPTLFVTGSRSLEMSAAAASHLELLEVGVKSQLLVFDGMDHGFINNPIPESTRAYRLAAQFFAENLGSKRHPK